MLASLALLISCCALRPTAMTLGSATYAVGDFTAAQGPQTVRCYPANAVYVFSSETRQHFCSSTFCSISRDLSTAEE